MRSNLMPEYWADKAAGAVYVLGKQVVDAALALVTIANYGNTEADKYTKAVADFDQAALAEFIARGTAKIKQRERTMLLNTQYAFGVMGQSIMALAFGQAGQTVVTTGTLPDLMGVPAARYDALPTNSENLGGVILGKSALLVAVAPPDPLAAAGEGNIVQRRVITDPESGVSVLYTMTVDGGGKLWGECSLLYGVAKGQDAVVRLTSA
jgi:hypothetical protein